MGLSQGWRQHKRAKVGGRTTRWAEAAPASRTRAQLRDRENAPAWWDVPTQRPRAAAHRFMGRASFQALVNSSLLMRATNTLDTPLSSKLRLAAATLDLLTSVATTWGPVGERGERERRA